MKRIAAFVAGLTVFFSACAFPVSAGQGVGASKMSGSQEELYSFDDILAISDSVGLIELPGGDDYEVLYKRSDDSGFAAKSTAHGGKYYINMKEGYQLSYEFLVYDGETEKVIDGGVFEPLYYQVQMENANSPSDSLRFVKNSSQAEKILYDLPQNYSCQGKNGKEVKVQRTITVTSLQTGEERRNVAPPVYVKSLGEAQPPNAVIHAYKVRKGDCLWKIALKELGRPLDWKLIYKINEDKIKDPDMIYEGQILDIPLR